MVVKKKISRYLIAYRTVHSIHHESSFILKQVFCAKYINWPLKCINWYSSDPNLTRHYSLHFGGIIFQKINKISLDRVQLIL